MFLSPPLKSGVEETHIKDEVAFGLQKSCKNFKINPKSKYGGWRGGEPLGVSSIKFCWE